jgi:hypothetical protein
VRRAIAFLLVCAAFAARADDLQRANELAWAKRFAEAEALYRSLPPSPAATLGLARVVLWQGRYGEAIALFARLEGADALEGQAQAQYWSGDLRGAARSFRRLLALDPNRGGARQSLDEILATARPSQRITIDGAHDDQPLDFIRAEAAATFFSDPQTRWTVSAGRYAMTAERVARDADGHFASIAGEATWRGFTTGATLGVFTFPDGVHQAIGGASVRRRSLTLRLERRPELTSATSLTTHAASTTTALRWDHDGRWRGAAEVLHRSYYDGNDGRAATAWGVVPLRRNPWTLWGGASVAARDTGESRFHVTSTSSTREQTDFRYTYRGEYDPYWTPDDLLEARAVVAVERRMSRGTLKLQADGGWARDRGRTFGPDVGPTPFPDGTFAFAFVRTYHPWRAGLTADLALIGDFRVEAGVERSVTVDYRSNSFYAALVRRR